ncbi:hypothetical protein [Aquimarina sp. 2201CG14-23]|uniref:hypothetical protein n=1 Tax=Aquimarina mycalae TaxID=3040073 RepID=UPI002477FD64|nr:hypothetical protein [Aquimarina sp. 2201CG14-23]MDH7447595.1 hypothetical protein [Aquimarina sp. 2201CG14-23]
MNDFYKIDEIGKMKYLSNLCCFSSLKEFKIKSYTITIEINSIDENEAKSLHTYIHSTLLEITTFDRKAKKKLKELYNPTERELEEIKVSIVGFHINKDFDLFYNLPKGSPMEYLSIKFSEDGVVIDSGGGNY